jgi:hypothetical protein
MKNSLVNKTREPVEIILSKGRGMRGNDGGHAPNQGTLWAYIEMPQGNPTVQITYTN